MVAIFNSGDKVMIRFGNYHGYKGIVDRWIHDQWYIVTIINADGVETQIMLDSSQGEMVKI